METKINSLESKTLVKDKDFIIYGFYDSVGLDVDDVTTLQVIYLIDGKYYVLFRDNDVLSGIIFKLDMICDMYEDKDKMYSEVSEFMSHFDASIYGKEKYKLFEIDIQNVHNLIPFDETSTLMPDDFRLGDIYCNEAILLSDGRIAVGDESFLEKTILENIVDKKKQYELLENIYYDFCDFEKREHVINEFLWNFQDKIEGFEKETWDNKRINNYLVLYALSLLGPLNIDFREIKDKETIEDKRGL